MATTISRTWYDTLIDDDGTNTTGSIWDKADVDSLLDAIDAIVAADVQFGGTIKERNRSTAMGDWTAVAHSAGNFTGNGSMTWTVAAGDQQTFAYTLVGKALTVAFYIQTSTVGGTPNTALQIAVPGSFTSAKLMVNPVYIIDNNARSTGYARVDAAATVIQIHRTDAANWSAATDTTYIWGQITFEIQ